MAKATIPLATGFNLKNMSECAYLMEKFDGVPIRVRVEGGLVTEATTRPGKPLTSSVQHLVDAVEAFAGVHNEDFEIIMEVQHPTIKNFKDLSGMVRRDKPCPELYGVVFDLQILESDDLFSTRLWRMRDMFAVWEHRPPLPGLHTLPSTILVNPHDAHELSYCKSLIKDLSPTPDDVFEGWILRDENDVYEANKRQPGYQKIVIEPTVDLEIVGFEEAISKDGEPLGMVGRVIAMHQGKKIGVGPGKLTHKERTALWLKYGECATAREGETGPIAEVKYKRDPSYDALRQPTFQHWRDDKDEPNET